MPGWANGRDVITWAKGAFSAYSLRSFSPSSRQAALASSPPPDSIPEAAEVAEGGDVLLIQDLLLSFQEVVQSKEAPPCASPAFALASIPNAPMTDPPLESASACSLPAPALAAMRPVTATAAPAVTVEENSSDWVDVAEEVQVGMGRKRGLPPTHGVGGRHPCH